VKDAIRDQLLAGAESFVHFVKFPDAPVVDASLLGWLFHMVLLLLMIRLCSELRNSSNQPFYGMAVFIVMQMILNTEVVPGFCWLPG